MNEEVRSLRARVESLARELGIALQLLHDHGLVIRKLTTNKNVPENE